MRCSVYLMYALLIDFKNIFFVSINNFCFVIDSFAFELATIISMYVSVHHMGRFVTKQKITKGLKAGMC